MKIGLVYTSLTGNNRDMAQRIRKQLAELDASLEFEEVNINKETNKMVR